MAGCTVIAAICFAGRAHGETIGVFVAVAILRPCRSTARRRRPSHAGNGLSIDRIASLRALIAPALLSLLAHAVLLSLFVPRWLRSNGGEALPPLLQARLAANAGKASVVSAAPKRIESRPLTRPVALVSPPPLPVKDTWGVEARPVAGQRPPAVAELRPLESRQSAPTVEASVNAGDVRAYRLALGSEIGRLRRLYQERFADAERESKQGLSGRVEFQLRVLPAGTMLLNLGKSSGYRQLDDEARGLFWRAAQTTELPSALRGQSFAIPLVMEFQLEN